MEAKSIAPQPSHSLPQNSRGIETFPALDVAFLAIIGLVMVLTILFQGGYASATLLYACIPKRKQPLFSLKSRHKLPCRRCRYFSGNPYLKCALHPVTVLTEQAVNCVDYDSPREAKRFKE